MRFYEGGWDSPPQEARVYTNVFSYLTTRYVNWELNLAYPPQPERIDYEIEVVYYSPDGTIQANQTAAAHVKKRWTNSSRSWGTGYRQPLQWVKGLYKVELFVEGQLIASGEFDIVDSRVPREGPFLELREGLPWNSWQPSIDEEKALLALAGLMEIDPALASAAASFPWVKETPKDESLWSLQALETLAKEDVELARRVLGFSWLADDMTKDEWLTVRTLTLLAVRDAAWARFIANFDWLQDGSTEDERRGFTDLRAITIEHPSLAETLLSLPWLHDDMTEVERRSLRYILDIAREDFALAQLISHFPWLHDDVTRNERETVQGFSRIVGKDLGLAQQIAEMPFLEIFKPADGHAIKALGKLVELDDDESSEHFQRVMAHSAIRDGITNEEAKIVATLRGVSEYNPGLVDTLLDPTQVTLEERSIDLPLAGEVQITIIRTRPGAERTMDLLAQAVSNIEEFMGVEFPNRHVIYLLEDATRGTSFGTNFGSHIASLPRVDQDDYSAHSAFRHISHETGHFYWRGMPSWIAEGAATFIEPFATNTATAPPIPLDRRPCAYAGNISDLESLYSDQGTPEFSCNYSLGERLFHDLYRNLDGPVFRQGFRNLYLLSRTDDPKDQCEGVDLGVCHVGAAFKHDGTAETAAIVDKLLARWYHGTEPFDTSHRDISPADPSLLSAIQVKLTRAYIALDRDRREESKTARFSASEVQGPVYVYLHFSYPEIREEREVPLTVVEYFADGFAYRPNDRVATFKVGWTSSRSWFRIGPSEERRWVPGRYWVYVYHEGQKVAEVEFQVTP